MLNKITYFVLVFLFPIYCFSQKDSLLRAVKICSPKDSALLLNKLAIVYRFNDGDSATYYATSGLQSSKIHQNIREQANAENALGVQCHLIGKYTIAMTHYINAEKLFELVKYEKGIASATQNIGNVYADQKKYLLANHYYLKAAEIYKRTKHLKGLAAIYNNIAISYSELGNIHKALEYNFNALSIIENLHDTDGISSSYGGIATCYAYMKDFQKSMEYNIKKLELAKKTGNLRDLTITYNNLGDAYLHQKDFEKAKECFLKGIEIAKPENNFFSLNDLYYNLGVVYEKTNDYKSAYWSLQDYFSAHDSLFKQQSFDKIAEMEQLYQSEKKELQIGKQQVEIKAKEDENKRKSIIIGLSIVALIAISFFAIIAFINFRKTKKAKLIIEEQKQLVELKNVEISTQKELVEAKQKEIIDSINYAKRIQTAVLSGQDIWSKISKDYFILFKPKDIVSGDFYWAYNTPNNRSIFLLADCTGHGVPGAFMSMLGNSFLNEIIVDNKIFKADAILNKLRAKIIKALQQEGNSEQKDGMDICLCVWNKIDNTLEFAGANNPMWLLRNNEIMEFKADKMPIGTYVSDSKQFTSQTIQLQPNDCIYLITDGFADQFGGEKGKKFKYKPLMDLLLTNNQLPMLHQKEVLNTAIENWKSGYEQVDDISLIGVKVA